MRAALLSVVLLLALATPAATQPLRIVLLVDTSGSALRGPMFMSHLSALNSLDLTYMTEAAAALQPLIEASDQVFLGVVGEHPRITTEPLRGADLMVAAQGLAEEIGGRSPLWDVLYNLCDRFDRTAATPIVILVTDGRANANEHSFAEAVHRLKTAGVRVFTVTRLEVHRKPDPDPSERLRELASATGGQHLAFTPGNLGDAIVTAMQGARRAATPR
jgi:hypothetical protein